MRDIIDELGAVQREVGSGRIPAGEGRCVTLRRSYDAAIEDVWEAVTSADRINRWFLPVTGDLRPGGSYQLEGNAGGEILQCEPPRLLRVTWVYGENPGKEDVSEVEVRLSPGERATTVLELTHTAVVPDDRWSEFGPGAVGVGWDGALLGLGLFLAGESLDDPEERAKFAFTPEGRRFLAESSKAWGAAFRASGATAEQVAIATKHTTAFYVPEPE